MKLSGKTLQNLLTLNKEIFCCTFRPGYKKRVPGQGMPLMSDANKYGDLIIEFDVEYPRGLNSDQKLYIREALIHQQDSKKQNQHRRKNATDAD